MMRAPLVLLAGAATSISNISQSPMEKLRLSAMLDCSKRACDRTSQLK